MPHWLQLMERWSWSRLHPAPAQWSLMVLTAICLIGLAVQTEQQAIAGRPRDNNWSDRDYFAAWNITARATCSSAAGSPSTTIRLLGSR